MQKIHFKRNHRIGLGLGAALLCAALLNSDNALALRRPVRRVRSARTATAMVAPDPTPISQGSDLRLYGARLDYFPYRDDITKTIYSDDVDFNADVGAQSIGRSARVVNTSQAKLDYLLEMETRCHFPDDAERFLGESTYKESFDSRNIPGFSLDPGKENEPGRGGFHPAVYWWHNHPFDYFMDCLQISCAYPIDPASGAPNRTSFSCAPSNTLKFRWGDPGDPNTYAFFAGFLVPLSGTERNPVVKSGQSDKARIVLQDPAPAGGVKVTLRSKSRLVTVPKTVTVPQGQSSVVFPFSTSKVSKDTSVDLTATVSGYTKWRTIVLLK